MSEALRPSQCRCLLAVPRWWEVGASRLALSFILTVVIFLLLYELFLNPSSSFPSGTSLWVGGEFSPILSSFESFLLEVGVF